MLLAVQALCDALAKRIKLWSLRAHLFEVIVKASNQGSSLVIRRWLTSRGFCTRPIYRSSQTVEPGGYATTLDRFVTKFKRGGISSWFNRLRASVNRARAKT